MTDSINLRDCLPHEMVAVAELRRCADRLREQGCNAEAVADYLFHVAWDMHSIAQGACQQAEGWVERAQRSFQRAVAGFCVETTNAGPGPDGCHVLLPYGPDGTNSEEA